jgi:hypothetical protein
MLLDNRSRSKSKSHIEVKRNLILMVSERAVRGHTGMTKTISFDREPIATDIPEIPIATIYALYFSGPIALFRAALTLLRATGLTAEQTLLLAASPRRDPLEPPISPAASASMLRCGEPQASDEARIGFCAGRYHRPQSAAAFSDRGWEQTA